jgi:hypothetical protein
MLPHRVADRCRFAWSRGRGVERGPGPRCWSTVSWSTGSGPRGQVHGVGHGLRSTDGMLARRRLIGTPCLIPRPMPTGYQARARREDAGHRDQYNPPPLTMMYMGNRNYTCATLVFVQSLPDVGACPERPMRGWGDGGMHGTRKGREAISGRGSNVPRTMQGVCACGRREEVARSDDHGRS